MLMLVAPQPDFRNTMHCNGTLCPVRPLHHGPLHQALSSSAGGVPGARVWCKLVQCSASVGGLNIGTAPVSSGL